MVFMNAPKSNGKQNGKTTKSAIDETCLFTTFFN